jgi:hypothetical protein
LSYLQKKQLRQEAEKVLQEKVFSNPAKEREKTELECLEEKQACLFGRKEINKENVNLQGVTKKENVNLQGVTKLTKKMLICRE